MKLGLMQPYFFPYLGYFSLIKDVDLYIFFDTPQYERRGWMNRNRILNSNGEAAYITVPIQKAPQTTAIKDIQIDYSKDWLSPMVARMVHYKKFAPNYEAVLELFQGLLSKKYSSLADLNIETIMAVCRYLGIETTFQTFSKMKLEINEVFAPDEWALNITKKLGYTSYCNPSGGLAFYDRKKYERAGIEINFLQAELEPYNQGIENFEPALSILDVLMFNAKEKVQEMLNCYRLV